MSPEDLEKFRSSVIVKGKRLMAKDPSNLKQMKIWRDELAVEMLGRSDGKGLSITNMPENVLVAFAEKIKTL